MIGDTIELPLTPMSSIAEVLSDPVMGPEFGEVITPLIAAMNSGPDQIGELEKMLAATPVKTLITLIGNPQKAAEIESVLSRANARHMERSAT